jgi:hypothetical protein
MSALIPGDVSCLLIGNKCDLATKKAIDTNSGKVLSVYITDYIL